MKNLIIRALTGIIFVVVLISAIYIHPIFFLILFCIITGLTLWEFGGLVKHYENANLQRTVNMLGGVYLFIATFVYANGLTDGKIFLPYLLFIMLTMIAELYYKAPNPINNWAFTLFAQVYCAGSFSKLNFIGAEPGTPGVMSYTPLFIMAIFIFVWLDDTGAYLVGSLIGKHKLFERISPKKSWEGSIGGGVVAIGVSFILAHYFPFMSMIEWAGLALAVVIFGTWGDLTESLLKRQLHVKDSGTILPGHGGMLDRFDSSLMAIPAAVVYRGILSQSIRAETKYKRSGTSTEVSRPFSHTVNHS